MIELARWEFAVIVFATGWVATVVGFCICALVVGWLREEPRP